MWHVTREMWHMTRDTWREVNLLWKSQVPSFNCLGFKMFWRLRGKGWLTEFMNLWMSNKGDCRTALTTLGLLTSLQEYAKAFKVCTDLQSMQNIENMEFDWRTKSVVGVIQNLIVSQKNICLILYFCHALQNSWTQSACTTPVLVEVLNIDFRILSDQLHISECWGESSVDLLSG